MGIAGYLSSLLGEPAVIEDGACDEPESDRDDDSRALDNDGACP
jgi:hypothetical protein